MRYGKVMLSLGLLEEFLCLKNTEFNRRIKRLTDLPDDVKIKTMYFNTEANRLEIILEGSGCPLFRIPENSTIPLLTIEYEDVDDKKEN